MATTGSPAGAPGRRPAGSACRGWSAPWLRSRRAATSAPAASRRSRDFSRRFLSQGWAGAQICRQRRVEGTWRFGAHKMPRDRPAARGAGQLTWRRRPMLSSARGNRQPAPVTGLSVCWLVPGGGRPRAIASPPPISRFPHARRTRQADIRLRQRPLRQHAAADRHRRQRARAGAEGAQRRRAAGAHRQRCASAWPRARRSTTSCPRPSPPCARRPSAPSASAISTCS